MEKVSKTYDPVSLTRILQGLERRIEALQSTSIKQYKSVAADAAQNLRVNEVGYTLDDSQNFDLLVRASDSRLYRISGQASAVAAVSSAPAGVYVLKSGDTMTGLLILSGDPAVALGAATKQYADTKVADTGDTMTGALVIDGSADAIQLRVQGHSTQTNLLLVLEDSAGNDQVTVSNVGKIYAAGEVEIDGPLNHDGSTAGFYSVTPVARPSAYTQTYSTATRTHAARTASTLTDNSAGTANTTVEALPDPTDTPASADALRDDIVANLLPALRNNFADLAAQINALKADGDNTAQVLNSCIDDRQLDGLAQ